MNTVLSSATTSLLQYGPVVRVAFYFQQQKLIMAEECYFYLMASMRKMRMPIPLSYTLEYFTELITAAVSEKQLESGVVDLYAFVEPSSKQTELHINITSTQSVLGLKSPVEIDVLREISVNTHILSQIHTPCPENHYAAVYAAENELDDVILLNPHKRIARCGTGNLLLLNENTIRIPKQTEGAYISPLMENFVTWLNKKERVTIEEAEINGFETQKAEELSLISDASGLHPVQKIRNKSFGYTRFEQWAADWAASFLLG